MGFQFEGVESGLVEKNVVVWNEEVGIGCKTNYIDKLKQAKMDSF